MKRSPVVLDTAYIQSVDYIKARTDYVSGEDDYIFDVMNRNNYFHVKFEELRNMFRRELAPPKPGTSPYRKQPLRGRRALKKGLVMLDTLEDRWSEVNWSGVPQGMRWETVCILLHLTESVERVVRGWDAYSMFYGKPAPGTTYIGFPDYKKHSSFMSIYEKSLSALNELVVTTANANAVPFDVVERASVTAAKALESDQVKLIVEKLSEFRFPWVSVQSKFDAVLQAFNDLHTVELTPEEEHFVRAAAEEYLVSAMESVERLSLITNVAVLSAAEEALLEQFSLLQGRFDEILTVYGFRVIEEMKVQATFLSRLLSRRS